MNNQTAYLFPAIGEQGKIRSSPIESRPRMSMPAVIICCLALLQLSAGSLYATKPPDVQVDTKTAPDAPLTLRQIYAKGKANYTTAAADAASNLASNQALLATLRDEANSSTHPGNKLGALMIERIAAIESRCDIVYAYSKPDYKGYFQMGADACQDVGSDFAVISKPENWKIGCDAGVKFLNLNWKRVAGADTDFVADGSDVPSLTALYLAHQQGATGAAALWSHLGNGSAKSTAANDNMRANVGPKTLTAIDGTGDHEMSELEFYAYWVGAIDAVSAQITTP